jgi:hypothetical protein
MKRSGNAIIMQRLLMWLMNGTLVFSLFAFSGHVSESKSYHSEPAKTEQATRINFKRTARFKKTYDFTNRFPLKCFEQTANFKSSLSNYGLKIEVKLRENSSNKSVKKKQSEQFLIHYPTDNSELSNTNNSRR